MGLTTINFFGRPPLFLPGTWIVVLGFIAFCYSIVFIGIVYGDTENENLKIAAFIMLFASFIVSISGFSWNFYFYEESKHRSILKRAYGGYGYDKLYQLANLSNPTSANTSVAHNQSKLNQNLNTSNI